MLTVQQYGRQTVITVCVDDNQDRELQGRLYSPRVGQTSFLSVLPLMTAMERLFDGGNYPQVTHERRRFPKARQTTGPEEGEIAMDNKDSAPITRMEVKPGEKATFIIQVRYRKNASWQGTIQWVETKTQQNFRSTLELIKLMDDAVAIEGDDYPGWERIPEERDE